ncbi:acylphosphatase [Collinsella tanakaei]|uniref:acylphosphatase n=1 Tax=Collinsella tanakaei TaxID=626935 RepID=UPI0025A3EBF7|nr:acylphosphatase [Collinsella tanakaei]MDM8299614.1 acylphosphatase [Collinsella tanakaei]
MGMFDRFVSGSRRGGGEQARRSPVELQLIERLQNAIAEHPENTPRLRLRLHFGGRVQGVGFRWTNQGLARERGLSGWVMNQSDGSVDMEIQGTPQQIVMHLDRLHAYYLGFNNNIWLEDEREISSVPDERTFEVRFETGLDL